MVEDRMHQVFVVRAVELDQDVVFARNEMTFGDFRYFAQVFDRLYGFRRVGDPDADDRTDVVAHRFRIYL